MENIIYFLAIFIGFLILLVSVFLINKKYSILSSENCAYSCIIFLIAFILFSKITHLFIDLDLNSVNKLFSSTTTDKLEFVFSGYSFIGGYIGLLISIIILSKLLKKDTTDIMVLFVPSALIMYSILKVGCYIKGCCSGITNFPIQLIETAINFFAFIFILILIRKNTRKNTVVGLSFISFGMLRLIISLFRFFTNIYTFIFVEMFCIFLVILGIKIKKYKK